MEWPRGISAGSSGAEHVSADSEPGTWNGFARSSRGGERHCSRLDPRYHHVVRVAMTARTASCFPWRMGWTKFLMLMLMSKKNEWRLTTKTKMKKKMMNRKSINDEL